ncbi:MAG TPA: class I SAM-dependent methyltransferase [Candidatus Cybelea sp.]|nr:class I SAM-dependent methyltransferase [Candidatus Cybelea sp.]
MSDQVQSTERFGDRAQAYATYRPSYPDEAIDAVLEGMGNPVNLEIADIGAGTGISSRLFADRGAHVIAIEPNAEMRAAATDHPRVDWEPGTGEDTGLPDLGVDIIVACQAFHWFATPLAMNEWRRVARRRAAVLQYERDERDPFTKAYGDIVRAHARDDTESMRMQALATFAHFPKARITRSAFSSRQTLDLDGVLGRAASSSYLPNVGPESDALRTALEAAFERFEQDGKVTIATVTFVLVADLV